MNHIVPGSAGGRKSPRAAVVPKINIVLRVKGNHSLPCRSAGGLNPHTFGTRACQQSIGIGVAKIILGQKGQLVEIIHRSHIIRCYSLFVHQVPVIGHIFIHAPHSPAQALILPCADLLL